MPLLNIMEDHKLDFHSTFRTLSLFKPSMLSATATEGKSTPLEVFISQLLTLTPEPEQVDHAKATEAWMAWLDKYSKRIESEESEWPEDIDVKREKAAKAVNPRFVLRQWVLEEVIAKVERDHDSGKRLLAKVMCVSGLAWFLYFFELFVD
jgi:uncharacterized protein YdiU (UPF0061 family)